jgi:hypothetical protein
MHAPIEYSAFPLDDLIVRWMKAYLRVFMVVALCLERFRTLIKRDRPRVQLIFLPFRRVRVLFVKHPSSATACPTLYATRAH